MLTGKVPTREYRLEVCLRALLEYAEWMEGVAGRMPSLSVMAARGELGIDPERPREPSKDVAMERLLKRAAEELHCGSRGIPLGRNAWDLLREIEFLLGAREEDRRPPPPVMPAKVKKGRR